MAEHPDPRASEADRALAWNDYEVDSNMPQCGAPGPRKHICQRLKGHIGAHMEFREHYTVGWAATAPFFEATG